MRYLLNVELKEGTCKYDGVEVIPFVGEKRKDDLLDIRSKDDGARVVEFRLASDRKCRIIDFDSVTRISVKADGFQKRRNIDSQDKRERLIRYYILSSIEADEDGVLYLTDSNADLLRDISFNSKFMLGRVINDLCNEGLIKSYNMKFKPTDTTYCKVLTKPEVRIKNLMTNVEIE